MKTIKELKKSFKKLTRQELNARRIQTAKMLLQAAKRERDQWREAADELATAVNQLTDNPADSFIVSGQMLQEAMEKYEKLKGGK